jgi:hypothetical protein
MFVSRTISGDALGVNEFLVLHALYLCSIQMFLVWKSVPSELSCLEHLALFCSKAELGSCPKKRLVKRECNLAGAQFVRTVTGIFCC